MRVMFKQRVLLVLGLFSIALSVGATSRVIRDNRLHDLAITPALGRGYSIATNTYQSLCLEKVKVTKPSYNMKYRYIDIEKDWESKFKVTTDTDTSMKFLFLKANVKTHTERSGTTTYTYHYIFAHIKLDSFYNSVNEAESKMSKHAINLLKKGDTIGFFESCGPYYVRSIGRHSSYMALLSYRTKKVERDFKFELKLKGKLKGFFSSASNSTSITGDFHSEMEEKRLSISSWAYGLGKDHLGDLIPTDITTFKKTVQDSIKAMQDADTGIVTNIEVVPWIENTEFQDSLVLRTENDRLMFEEKKNIEGNAEIIAEINRIDRAQMDQYYKALNCRRILEEEYLLLEGDYAFNPDHTWMRDLIAPTSVPRMVTLKYMDQVLSKAKVGAYFDKNKVFFIRWGNTWL